MANLIDAESFDSYASISTAGTGLTTGGWTIISTNVISFVTGRFGGQALRFTQGGGAAGFFGGNQLIKTLSATPSSMAIGMALRANSPMNDRFMQVREGSSVNIQVAWDSTLGQLSILNAAGTALYTSPVGSFPQSLWHGVGIELVVNATTGSVRIYKNGVVVTTVTGLNTKGGATGICDNILIGNANGGSGASMDIDDMTVWDSNAYPGERKIEPLRPVSDALKTFTCSTGTTNWSCVDETLIDLTDYVTGTTVGDRDLYTLTSLSTVPTTIDAIIVNMWAQKTDAATRSICASLQSNSVDQDGASVNLSSSVTRVQQIFATDPSGGGAWTAARVNALKAGMKVAA